MQARIPECLRSRLSFRYWGWLLGQASAASIFAAIVFISLRGAAPAWDAVLHQRPGGNLMSAIDWTLALAFNALIAGLLVFRRRRLTGDRRPLVIVVCGFAAFSVMVVNLIWRPTVHPDLVATADVLILFGMAWTIWSLAHLGRSFSILPEARSLVTSGPYAWCRHPVYLGETLGIAGLLLETAGWDRLLLGALYLAAQTMRMRWEESVLAAAFADRYLAYAKATPRYLPGRLPFWRPVRRGRGRSGGAAAALPETRPATTGLFDSGSF